MNSGAPAAVCCFLLPNSHLQCTTDRQQLISRPAVPAVITGVTLDVRLYVILSFRPGVRQNFNLDVRLDVKTGVRLGDGLGSRLYVRILDWM
jgi:hypothetical protein